MKAKRKGMTTSRTYVFVLNFIHFDNIMDGHIYTLGWLLFLQQLTLKWIYAPRNSNTNSNNKYNISESKSVITSNNKYNIITIV